MNFCHVNFSTVRQKAAFVFAASGALWLNKKLLWKLLMVAFLQADFQDAMFSETKLNAADISSQPRKSWGRFGLTEGLLWLKNELCGKL